MSGPIELHEDTLSLKQTHYIPYKRRVQQRNLKPIISETQLQKGNHNTIHAERLMALNVEGVGSKATLVSGEEGRGRKINETTRRRLFSDVEQMKGKVKGKSKHNRKSVAIFEQKEEDKPEYE